MKLVRHEQKPVKVPPPTFDLIGLEQREVEALMSVLYHVGGEPAGPRGAVEHIAAALAAAGIKPVYQTRRELGSIYFKDSETAKYNAAAPEPSSLAQVQAQRIDLDVMKLRDTAAKLGVPERLVR